MKEIILFGYGRVSSEVGGDGRSRQEASVQIQDMELRDYITRTFPGVEPTVFLERHTGAFAFGDIRTRPAGALLMQNIIHARQLQPHAEIHLIFTKVDRLGRGWLEGQILLRELEHLNVIVHFSALGGRTIDTRDAIGRKMISDLLWMAEMEVGLIQNRIQTSINHKFSKGEVIGTVPYGWDAVETGEVTPKGVKLRRREDNVEEQRWILHMAALHAAGHSYNAIALDLNRRGVPTKNRGAIMRVKKAGWRKLPPGERTEKKFVSGQWQAGQVQTILESRTVRDWLNHDQQQAA